MGIIDPSIEEIRLIRMFFLESARLLGTPSKISKVISYDLDLFNDAKIEYETDKNGNVKVDIYLILTDTLDKVHKSRKNNFVKENEETNKLQAYIWIDIDNLDFDESILMSLIGSILTINFYDSKIREEAEYKLVKLWRSSNFLLVGDLVPYRENDAQKIQENTLESNDDLNYKFVKR